MYKTKKNSGFTLIELLVVIVIIGILATISVFAFRNYQQMAAEAKIKAELRPLMDAIFLARINTGKVLLQITGSGCSDCVCRGLTDVRNLPDDHACVRNWENALSKIAEAAMLDLNNFKRDPWGSPYMLDENEYEAGCRNNRNDRLGSAGPDGRTSGEGGGYIYMNVPYSKCNGYLQDINQTFKNNSSS